MWPGLPSEKISQGAPKVSTATIEADHKHTSIPYSHLHMGTTHAQAQTHLHVHTGTSHMCAHMGVSLVTFILHITHLCFPWTIHSCAHTLCMRTHRLMRAIPQGHVQIACTYTCTHMILHTYVCLHTCISWSGHCGRKWSETPHCWWDARGWGAPDRVH